MDLDYLERRRAEELERAAAAACDASRAAHEALAALYAAVIDGAMALPGEDEEPEQQEEADPRPLADAELDMAVGARTKVRDSHDAYANADPVKQS